MCRSFLTYGCFSGKAADETRSFNTSEIAANKSLSNVNKSLHIIQLRILDGSSFGGLDGKYWPIRYCQPDFLGSRMFLGCADPTRTQHDVYNNNRPELKQASWKCR